MYFKNGLKMDEIVQNMAKNHLKRAKIAENH
jgi:hypothetical protein